MRDSMGLLTPVAAASASEGIRRDTGAVSWFHWPNLVTLGGRVVARTSLSIGEPRSPGRGLRLTFRVSVNCSADVPADSDSELGETSIRDVLGVEIDRDMLRDKVLHALDWYYAEWQRGAHQKLADRIEPTIPWLGREVEVATVGGEVLRGTARGLDRSGSLLLEEGVRRGAARTRALSPHGVRLVLEAE